LLEAVEAPSVRLDRPTHLIPITFRNQTITQALRQAVVFAVSI